MDDKDVGANAVVRVLPMATAVARAAVVDRENFMVLFVQQRSTVFVRDVMSVLQRNRVLIMFIPSSFIAQDFLTKTKFLAWSRKYVAL